MNHSHMLCSRFSATAAAFAVLIGALLAPVSAQWEARFGAPAINPTTGEALNPSLIYDSVTGVLSIDNAGNNGVVDSIDNSSPVGGDDVGMISVVLSTAFDTNAQSLLPIFEDGVLWSTFVSYFNGAMQLQGSSAGGFFLPISETAVPIVQFPAGLTFLDFVGPGGFIDIEIGTNFGPFGDAPPSLTLFPVGNPLQSGAFQFTSLVLGPGDFNTDAVYDCGDVDSLVAEIAAGNNDPLFDLTSDGMVDQTDLDAWLAEAGLFNNANGGSYLPGDINLSGSVDVSDFGIWNTHKFSSTPAWCSGDLNADGVVDIGDFNIWNSNKFTFSVSPSAVPEPGAVWFILPALCFLLQILRNRR